MSLFSTSILHKAADRNSALRSPSLRGNALALVILGLMSASAAHAQTVYETGDAGQTLSTAQNISANSVTAIMGSLADPSDADLYLIYINSPSTFSASTVNTVTNDSGLDTELSLFDANGHGIAENDDDASGLVVESTLPAGNAHYSGLTAGYYYLGISSSDNEPINSVSQLIFQQPPGGDTTAVRGPASGLNPTVLFNFNSNEYDTTTYGSYEIDLTGAAAAVPEASTTVSFGLLLALGLGGGVIAARKKNAAGKKAAAAG